MFNFNSESFLNRAKQFGKGALLFLTGAAGYFGFNAVFGKRDESQDSSLAIEAKNNLVDESLNFVVFDNLFKSISISSLAAKKIPLEFKGSRREIGKYEFYASDEFRINGNITGDQGVSGLAIKTLTKESFVVAYSCDLKNEDANDVYQRIFEVQESGKNPIIAVIPETRVNDYILYDQQYPSVAKLSSKKYVVVWHTSHYVAQGGEILAKIFNDNGAEIMPEFLVNTYLGGHQRIPVIRALENSNRFVVAWHSYNHPGDSMYGVFARIFDDTGYAITSEININEYKPGSQGANNLAVDSLGDNKFVAVWDNHYDGSDYGVYGRIFDNDGYNITGDFLINEYTTNAQGIRGLAISKLQNDEFVVVWDCYYNDNYDVRGRVFYSTGYPKTMEFPVNRYTDFDQGSGGLDVASLNGEDFIVIWNSNQQDGYGNGVYMGIFDSTGHMIVPEFRVNNFTDFNQGFGKKSVAVSVFPDDIIENKFLAVWNSDKQDGDGSEVYARIFFTCIAGNPPKLTMNRLIITEGKTIILDDTMLNATHSVNGTGLQSLIFTVNDLQHGKFEYVDNSGYTITQFSKQDIDTKKVQFTHDDSESAPSYTIRVREGGCITGKNEAKITFNYKNDNIPLLVINQLTIYEGATVVLDNTMLRATDVDKNTLFNFIARDVQHGAFKKTDNPSLAINSFTNQELINSQIVFSHNGNDNAPYYEIKVSDGQKETEWIPANITFYNIADPTTKETGVLIGGIIGGVIYVLCTSTVAAIITVTGVYVAKNRKQLQKERQKSIELENTLLQDFSFELGNFLNDCNVNPKDIKMQDHLGSGAQATVYKAIWEGKPTAYKIFKTIDQKDVEKFEQEARIMLKSNHPNIVRLYGICIKQGAFGLVMEFMELGTLKEVLQKQQPKLSWKAKWNIAHDLASALKFLHSKGFVHRDIKTDNVLLHKDGEEIHAKVADFGLSKMRKAQDQSVTMAVGTFKYMAPEMIMGADGYEVGKFPMEPVDIYALGMVFVALITGKEPYPDKKNDMSIPSMVGHGKLWQEVDEQKCPFMFFNLTNRCRAIKSADRPTAEKIVEELDGMKSQVVGFK